MSETDVIGQALRGAAHRARGLVSDGSSFIPIALHPKQEEFFDDDRKEILFGGACGGGKSLAQLASALKYCHVPGYAALLIRRSYSHLSQPGGLIPLSREWLGGKAVYSAATFTWTFPSGATLTFGHLDSERDLDKYQGAEFQYIGFDEATQFVESHFRYLFSRLRKREGVDVPLRMRATSNPGGVGHHWVKQRYIIEEADDRRFIPSVLQDNPSLNQAEYLESLQQLDPLTRARLLDGDWDVLPEGGFFERGWFHVIEAHSLPRDIRWSRFWDRAATVPKKGRDPDYTAGALVGLHQGIWYVKHIMRFRDTPEGNERRIRRAAEADGCDIPVWMEEEPGSSGKDAISHYARHVLPGYNFKGRRSTGNKAERAAPVASAAEMGNLKLVSGPWVSDFLDEAAAFPAGPHDDMVDALSGAFAVLHEAPFEFQSFRVLDL